MCLLCNTEVILILKSVLGDVEEAGQIKCLLYTYETPGLGPQNPTMWKLRAAACTFQTDSRQTDRHTPHLHTTCIYPNEE